MAPRDVRTLDLFAWEPPQVVERFEPAVIKAYSIQNAVAKGVAATYAASGLAREEIAARMTEYLGEPISLNMINAWASEARGDHNIPFYRLLGLIKVTGDRRLLQFGAETVDAAVIDNKWLPWVELGQIADKKDELDKAFNAVRYQARKALRS
ncbi:DNA transposition protein [Nitrospirillum amazonense]|uniref:DNA transposition protein n=1 Tax=Nitrospirillum amazonense TaxID=28077 RepID=UPI00241248C3|nr:DNA transposition protein [Nitrospirillum amazonense]MDG3444690.1 DNA transposition protein [Nitrospirillum amazonense]